ncbi:MAG TPA: hypothetical protein VM889_05300 [Candidatus Thermoplasmatota archaeon]|jgi:DMSO/TMAO reductase YedYZ molybdopterin-dependent catalytic subunit|nr:hypothetical protein [Candidatus Thermoplasmatota archaeon]
MAQDDATWRGFPRDELLERARLAAEDGPVTDDTIDLIDEMESWTARDLYGWLLENEPRFGEEARRAALSASSRSR